MKPALLLLLMGRLTVGAPVVVHQTPVPLGEIKVTGTKRFTPADLVKVSGLAIGRPATGADFQAAATRADASGLFKQFKYTYAVENGKWVLTFEIEDHDWNLPVVFDNFIWFGEAEVVSAVRNGVPTFDGAAPSSPRVTASISTALQQLLTARSIPGRIELLPEGDLRSLKGYLFRVVDPAPLVCTWTFKGASRISPKDLESEMTAAGRAYSKSFVTRRSAGTVLAKYRKLGYWRAAVGEPETALVSASGCDGVSVTMTVSEGEKYRFKGAEWLGNRALPAGDLNKMLWLRPGDEAGNAAIDEGLRRVTEQYAIRGYVTATAKYEPHLDDATHVATFRITIDEGPQFKMGAVEFAGTDQVMATQLAKRWRLKPGVVFDASYAGKFQREEITPRLPRGAQRPSLQMTMNRESNTVDVRFTFGR